ncbi:BTAD domain-containing putative transcriptional regulator [Sporosarcina thermotolerans]|uniref:BTAD domain-containing putative transcriptional regulator n=1 Tax=Sporosarcina thermotolerans TaxID=633404 RepID=A0AAW9A7K7_9BACL|nr:BTAD domain-containing putative transcriptional regulator [Sporosarcina thermotolerans]MDW0116960.1 BTAD domain-containing putative transcriptional regulator [Sporosarcina thermotolerans]WHT47924.1 BTAD domain-containing putative transcriptional regulator [Sporosarcina thermotolerans]
MQTKPILLSKLMPPTPSATYMRRASFVKKMKMAEKVKLTLLHSGAGYGKSSGLAAYFHDTRALYSWFSVTEADDDILPFITYLTESIRRVCPHFGDSLSEWDDPDIYPRELYLERWLALFMNELFELEKPFFIVIDDFHYVDHVFQINYLIEKMIGLLPPQIHLVVATRNRPRWSGLVKLKLTGQLTELVEEDFLFSEEEVSVFFEDYFDQVLTSEEAASIIQLTEGWAIAVNLLAIHVTDAEGDLSVEMKPALQDLFAYLSEEVFNRMMPEEQEWALAFSMFPMFSEELIKDFYGEQAALILKELAGRHVFIQSIGEGIYRYHALFQQFLERKWLTVDKQQYEVNQKKAAELYLHRKEQIPAISHALKSGDTNFIGKTILENGAALIKSGQFEWLLEILKGLSFEMREIYYPLYYFEGEAHRYRAFYEKAREAYSKCIQIAEKLGDDYYAGRANAGIAHIYLDTIQPGLAESYLMNAILLAEKSEKTTPLEMELLKRQFAENLVNLGRASAAAEWVEREIHDKSILREGNLDARIALRRGKLIETQAILSSRVDDSTLPDAHRETDVLLSLIYVMTGQTEQAMESAAKGIRLGVAEKSGFIEAVGRIRMGHAKILADPTDLITPKEFYIQAIERMDELNVSRGNAEAYMGLSILTTREGNYSEAIQYGKAGLHETERVNDGWLSGLIHVGLSIVYFYARNEKESESHLQEAERIFKECGDHYGEMVVAFWFMAIYDRLDNDDLFRAYSKQCFSLMMTHHYSFFLSSDTIFGPFDRQSIHPLVLKAARLLPTEAGIQQVVHFLQLDEVVSHPGYKLDVRVLGPFTMYLGFDEVDERKWQRDKAKELFLYLLLNKNRYVPKEEIMQALWMDADEKSADRDFKVALNALLKVIEPVRSAREPSFFILRKQTMYRLNPRAEIRSDLDQFNQFMEKGLSEKDAKQTVESLMKAASLYKGKLFEEKLSVEWIAHQRDQTEQHFIQVIERLAQSFTRLREYGKTIEWAERLLHIEPTWEEAYRLLMYAHYQLQNRPQSIKWYMKCKAVLQEEFAIEPMETTEQMYRMIMNEL